jgi:hypothetical protein
MSVSCCFVALIWLEYQRELAGCWLAGLPESSHLVVALQNSMLRRNWFSAFPQVPRFEVLSEHQPESQRLQKAVVSKRASHAERKLLSEQNNMKKPFARPQEYSTCIPGGKDASY